MKKKYFFLLTLLILFHFMGNLVYFSRDNNIKPGDETSHLYFSAFYFNRGLKGLLSLHYPPLMYANTFLFYSVLGSERFVAMMSNFVFFALLMVSSYFLSL